MNIIYRSTRNHQHTATASEAVLRGLAPDGGLYVPDRLTAIDTDFTALAEMSYQELAFEVLSKLLTDYTEAELKYCIASAYDEKFDTDEIVPMTKVDGAYHLELFHGPTIAFKDMALSILPYLMTTAAKKQGMDRDIVILTATSGDTGKAAMAGFADVEHTKIIVFYPKDGVSVIQEQQMLTQTGANTYVVGIHGNFDDAQTGVKKLFADQALAGELEAAGLQFSSANSINIGRLAPQIVYYVYGYCRLVKRGVIKAGDRINVCVPTGNFGNILAAWYAKGMGLPIAKCICASNENKVLFDFFTTGVYDRNRDFVLTTSPSMDILISSNLERLIYAAAGQDSTVCAGLMKELQEQGVYSVSEQLKSGLHDFIGGYATEIETINRIREVYEQEGYVMDTHTAVASQVYHKYRTDSGDETVTLLASTASPYKFVKTVVSAIAPEERQKNEFRLLDILEKLSGVPQPAAVRGLETAQILHQRICRADQMKLTVQQILGLDQMGER
ncbi:MAG: threonine synthase [Lachnospiraceae bacterium]|nr:threonine synthase [Lachnospiraceae bacterium]